MVLLQRARSYSLRHVDADTGFGLLYSEARDRCVFLNPIAVALWGAVDGGRDRVGLTSSLPHVASLPGGADYLDAVTSDLEHAGLLVPSDDTEELAARPIEPGYPLTQIYFYATRDCNARCYHCYQPTRKVRGAAKSRPASFLIAPDR